MYCEANDLLRLPPITLDSVSEQLRDNRKSLDNLDKSVKTLQVYLSSTRAPLSKELATVKGQIAKLHRSPPPLASDQPHAQPGTTLPVTLLRSSNTNTQHSERHTNLIFFGLEETWSLSDTKALADEILEFVAGRPVSIGDLVRLGRPKKQPDADPFACRPRPVFIKLTSSWDRRLVLASKRKLKEFRISRLFLREDLSLEKRQKRRKPINVDPTRSIDTSGAAVEPLVADISSSN